MRFIKSSLTGLLIATGLFNMSACSLLGKSDAALPYGDWQLSEITQGSERMSLQYSDNRFTLSLNSDGTASGQVACNRWNGKSIVTDKTVQIENAGSTRKRCHISDERLQALEGRYLRSLKSEIGYQLKEGQLRLTIGEREQWIFVAQQQ